MISLAIIEDDEVFLNKLKNDINKISVETGKKFDIVTFSSMEEFLLPRRNGFNIVIFDIELPGMNGMDGARRFRLNDTDAIIIFITSLANYAVKGYEVDAMDYMIKPISYNNLSLKLQKAIRKLDNRQGKTVVLHSRNGVIKLNTDEIHYIEVSGHLLSVYTDNGIVETTGNLSTIEEELSQAQGGCFSRCNSCYLVNMRSISRLDGMTVYLKNGVELAISRRKKKEFLSEFTKYVGQ